LIDTHAATYPPKFLLPFGNGMNTARKWNRLSNLFGAAKSDLGTSSEIFESTHYKPGGTTTISLGKYVHKLVETGGDLTGYGRWTRITYLDEDGKITTIMSAYQVGNQ
jgi:hypothetical protein